MRPIISSIFASYFVHALLVVAMSAAMPLHAAEICWYEPGDPPIEHCCGEPQEVGTFRFTAFAFNPPTFITYSELEWGGRDLMDDCGNFSRVTDYVNITCNGSGANCVALNAWNVPWRPTGYIEGTTVVTITP